MRDLLVAEIYLVNGGDKISASVENEIFDKTFAFCSGFIGGAVAAYQGLIYPGSYLVKGAYVMGGIGAGILMGFTVYGFAQLINNIEDMESK